MTHAFTTCDRVRLDFAPSVSPAIRSAVLEAAYAAAEANGMHVYGQYDKEIAGWSIDITANDRAAQITLTDGQAIARLRSIAESSGITLAALLRKATDMVE